MKFLFVHQNFPAQFGRLAAWLTSQPQHQVVYLTKREDVEFGGIQKAIFKEHREASKETHRYVRSVESAVIQGQGAVRTALALREQGFSPDVIYGHSGFGATLYLKDIFPKSAFVGYFEWYYDAHKSDAIFDPADVMSVDDECRIRTRNMMILPDLTACDVGVTPTYWQHRQFPLEYAEKLRVIHDGIDTQYFAPNPQEKLVLPDLGLDLSGAQEIITYVGRGMEPYRGFPQFMEAVSRVMKRRKKCHVVIVGADRICYGKPHPSGKSYKEVMLEAFPYDENRLHFTGPLAYGLYKRVLQASTVHVYLTFPFVLSWSMLESMACGCTLVSSATGPVQEVVQDGENGLLVDFFSPKRLAERIEEALVNKELRRKLSANARETIVTRYDANRLLPLHLRVLQQAAARR